MSFMNRLAVALTATVAATAATSAVAQNVKIGIVAFISGPAAAPFGVPAKNAADFVIEELNAGRGPAPYDKKGFGGATIETVVVDEARRPNLSSCGPELTPAMSRVPMNAVRQTSTARIDS